MRVWLGFRQRHGFVDELATRDQRWSGRVSNRSGLELVTMVGEGPDACGDAAARTPEVSAHLAAPALPVLLAQLEFLDLSRGRARNCLAELHQGRRLVAS